MVAEQQYGRVIVRGSNSQLAKHTRSKNNNKAALKRRQDYIARCDILLLHLWIMKPLNLDAVAVAVAIAVAVPVAVSVAVVVALALDHGRRREPRDPRETRSQQ